MYGRSANSGGSLYLSNSSRTKKIKLCLSVMALPHYDIRLLIKQLEDLYKLGDGRLMLGVGPGASPLKQSNPVISL